MKTIWTLMCALCFVPALVFYGCDVPYSGGFGPGDLDRLLEAQGDDTICLDDGFDTACIKVITGQRGIPGESIVGPRGRDGLTIITLRTIQSIVYVLPKTQAAESTELTVEIGQPITEAMVEITPEPESVEITPTADGGTVEIVPNPEADETTVKVTPSLPVVGYPQALDGNEIWHVMYRNDSGQATVFAYPRCFNNPYHNPPRPPCADDYGITEETFLEVSKEFSIELQGDRESVRYLLGLALAEDNASLVQVGGVQGVVN